MSEMQCTFQALPAVVCRQKSSPGAGDHKSGLARVCTSDRKTASANVKVEIEDSGSPGFVIRHHRSFFDIRESEESQRS